MSIEPKIYTTHRSNHTTYITYLYKHMNCTKHVSRESIVPLNVFHSSATTSFAHFLVSRSAKAFLLSCRRVLEHLLPY